MNQPNVRGIDTKELLKYADRAGIFVKAFEATFGQGHVNVESFNEFVEVQAPKIISESATFEFISVQDNIKHVVSFSMSSIGKPVLIQGDSDRKETTPHEVEHLQETFSSDIMIDVQHEQYDLQNNAKLLGTTIYHEYKLLPAPVMIGSRVFPCDDPLVANYVSNINTVQMSRGRKPKLPSELVGYFVINGNSKNLIAQDRVPNNVIFVHPVKRDAHVTTEIKPKGPGDKPGDDILKCEYRSWSENKIRSTSTLTFEIRRMKSDSYELQIISILPFVKKSKPHVVGLFRLLGVLDNERTVRMILGDRSENVPEGEDPVHDNEYFVRCVRDMILESQYSHMSPLKIAREISTTLNMTAAAAAQARVFMRNDVDSDDEQDEEESDKPANEDVQETVPPEDAENIMLDPRVSSVRHMFCSEFFPHVGTDTKPETCAKKIAMLVNIVRKMLYVAFGIEGARHDLRDDDPYYKTPGMLLSSQLRLYYRETLTKFQTLFGRRVNGVFYKDKKTGETKRRDLNPLDSLTTKTLVQGMMTAMATGKWGKHKGTSQNGVAQQLPRNNNMSAMSHLRRLNKALPRESKDPRVRQLRNAAWGRICPSDTPEGASCGLTNPMPIFASIRLGYPSRTFIELLESLRFDSKTGREDYSSPNTIKLLPYVLALKIEDAKAEALRLYPNTEECNDVYSSTYCELAVDPSVLLPEEFYQRNQVAFMVNGQPVGFSHEKYARYFEKALVLRRRSGMIPHDVTVDYEPRKGPHSVPGGTFNFDVGDGCVVRLLGVSENLNLLPGIILAHASDPNIMMMELIGRGCFEFVSRREERYGVVALSPLDVLEAVRSKRPIPPRYEVNVPAALFGYVAAITPFPEMNPTPRLIYVGAMSKQTMAYTSPNNTSTSNYSLWSGQNPICKTTIEQIVGFEPYGQNVVLSVMSHSKEQEDATTMNKASSDRGSLRCTSNRRYSESITLKSGTGEAFEIPTPDNCLGMKHGIYDTLDEDGAAPPGTVLFRNSVIIGKTANTTGDVKTENGIVYKRDHSCQIKNTDIQDEDFGDTSGAAEFRKIVDLDNAKEEQRRQLEELANRRAAKRAHETLGDNHEETLMQWAKQPPSQIDQATNYYLTNQIRRQLNETDSKTKHWSKTPGSEVPYMNCTRKPNSPCHAGPKLVVDKTIRGGKADSEFITVTTRSQRIMTIGDKITSRHGQKGTCAELTAERDMSFCVGNELCHGIIPDINMGKFL